MVTKSDLVEFQQFADQRVASGQVRSLAELAGEWEAKKREMEATVSDIQQSHRDIESGNVSSVSEAFANARRHLGE